LAALGRIAITSQHSLPASLVPASCAAEQEHGDKHCERIDGVG
jgi:hypothetical protein